MASTRFAGSVFAIMIIILVFHAHEAYGASVAKTVGRKALRDGKMEVFMKDDSGGGKPKFSENDDSDQVSAENASDEVVNVMNKNDYGGHDDEPPHGHRKPPINNNDPKH